VTPPAGDDVVSFWLPSSPDIVAAVLVGDMPPKHTSFESPSAHTLWKYLGGGICPFVSSFRHTRVIRSSAYISFVSCGLERDRMRPPKTKRTSPTTVVEGPTKGAGSLPVVLRIVETSVEKFCDEEAGCAAAAGAEDCGSGWIVLLLVAIGAVVVDVMGVGVEGRFVAGVVAISGWAESAALMQGSSSVARAAPDPMRLRGR